MGCGAELDWRKSEFGVGWCQRLTPPPAGSPSLANGSSSSRLSGSLVADQDLPTVAPCPSLPPLILGEKGASSASDHLAAFPLAWLAKAFSPPPPGLWPRFFPSSLAPPPPAQPRSSQPHTV